MASSWAQDQEVGGRSSRVAQAFNVSPANEPVGDSPFIPFHITRYLLSYDSVTYNSYLETLIASNSTAQGAAKQNQSPWLYLDAANTLFQSAKKRAYTIAIKDKSRNSSTPGVTEENEEDWEALREAERDTDGYPITHKKQSKWPEGVQPVLEELPKWKLLGEVLEEIETEIAYGPEIDLSTSTRHRLDLFLTLPHSIYRQQCRIGPM